MVLTGKLPFVGDEGRQSRCKNEYATNTRHQCFLMASALRMRYLIQAQMSFTVLIKGFNWPTLHIQGEDPLRMPVHPIAHQHGIGARQLRVLEADHQPDFSQPGEPDSQGKGPISFVAYRHSPIRCRRNEWYQVFHRNVWPRQPD